MKRLTRRQFLKQAGTFAVSAGVLSGCTSGLFAADDSRKDKRPNILFFFPDQHRFDWIGLNPDLPLRTPNLDALAKRGTRFTNAVCPSPLCAPSRAALASGKEYDRCGVSGNGFNYPVEQTTFYKLLKDSGYHVTGCGKFDLRKKAKSFGRDGKHNVDGKCYLELWGFSNGIDNSGKHDGMSTYRKGKTCPYLEFLKSKGLLETHVDDFSRRRYPNFENTEPTPLPEEAYADNWIAGNGLELIRQAPKDKPWFLQVNFNGPHEPMDITKRMKEPWRGVKFPQPNGCTQFTPEKHIEIRQHYAAMIENIDRWLGIYIDHLKKTGQFDNTLIVYSSDHGEMLGDHDRWCKHVPYHPSVGVPLIIAGAGVHPGLVYDAPATTMDLAATFLDCAGLAVLPEMESRSMMPLLAGKTNKHRKFVRSGLGPWRMVFDGRYKLVQGFDPARKKFSTKEPYQKELVLLFDLKQDPLENANIADKAPDVVGRLTAILDGA